MGRDYDPARKRIGVNLLIVALIAACFFEIVTGREHWPFSPYPMFSSAEESNEVTRLVVVGTTGLGDTVDLVDPAWTSPMDPVRLRIALGRIAHRGDDALATAANDLLIRYESNRLA